MEIMPCDVDSFQFFLRHLDASLIHVPIKPALHLQPRFGGRRLNKADDHHQRLERSSSPILGDAAEQPVLYLVPLRSARRKMGNMQLSVPDQRPQFPQEPLTGASKAMISGARVRILLHSLHCLLE